MTVFRSVQKIASFSRATSLRFFSNEFYVDGQPKIAGRANMPGDAGGDLPKVLSPPRENFPYVCDLKEAQHGFHKAKLEDVGTWGQDLGEHISALIDKYAAVLVRGLPVDGAAQFTQLMHNFGGELMPYLAGSSIRKGVAKGVDTASEEPPNFNIELHNEMSDNTHYPSKIFFYCERAADEGKGGETAIADVREIYRNLDKSLIEKLNDLGVRYHRFQATENSSKFKSWQQMYLTDSKEEAESYLKEAGKSHEWHGDDLAVWYTLPTTRKHGKTGEKVWFNQAASNHASYFRANPNYQEIYADEPDNRLHHHSYYGDGTELEPELIQHIREVSWRAAIGYQLRENELMALDNLYVQHARLSFEGKRRLLVSMM